MATHGCKQCAHYFPNSNFGVPACGALNQLLGTHTNPDNPAMLESFASTCMSFEQASTPNTRQWSQVAVTIGVNLDGQLKAHTYAASNPGRTDKPSSCSQCQFFAQPKTVQNELGWVHGACTVKGQLVLQSEVQNVAQKCAVGMVGPPAATTSGIRLSQGYTGMSVQMGAPKRVTLTKFDPLRHIQTDPREWETDRPVSPEDEEAGVIRAWRRVDDPKGKQPPLFMPIFNWKELGIDRDPRESYGEHTPDLYEDHAGLLYWFAFLYGGQWCDVDAGEKGLKETLMLLGEAGTGKTEFWCYVAWLMDLPFARLSLRPDMETIEFFGSPALVPDPSGQGGQITTFKPGRFTVKYTTPCVICLDEPNAANDSVWFLLRPCLDSAGQYANETEGVVIQKDDLCFVGLAANPPWNPLYTGTRPLSAADSSRLSKRFVELPGEETERHIVKAHCARVGYDIPVTILDRLFRIAHEIREMYKNGDSAMPWGIRDMVKVAKLTWGLDMIDAFRTATLDELSREDANTVMSIVQAQS